MYVGYICVIQVQYIAESNSVCSTVFFFSKKKKEKNREKKGEMASGFPWGRLVDVLVPASTGTFPVVMWN
jgi:hypothetical protein